MSGEEGIHRYFPLKHKITPSVCMTNFARTTLSLGIADGGTLSLGAAALSYKFIMVSNAEYPARWLPRIEASTKSAGIIVAAASISPLLHKSSHERHEGIPLATVAKQIIRLQKTVCALEH